MKSSAVEFEAWMRTEHPTHPLTRLPQADGSIKYSSAGTEHKWVGWQGAMAQKAGNAGRLPLAADPDIALLVAMANCLDHDFNLLTAPQQRSWLLDMKKVYDQISGQGFYRPEDRLRYIEHLAAELRSGAIRTAASPTGFSLTSARADLNGTPPRSINAGDDSRHANPGVPTGFSLESARADLDA